jgi:DNA-binding CsgD family transcriptional regulator
VRRSLSAPRAPRAARGPDPHLGQQRACQRRRPHRTLSPRRDGPSRRSHHPASATPAPSQAPRRHHRPHRLKLRLQGQRTRLELAPPAPEHSNRAAPATLGLTPRELEILGLLAKGLTNREIADALVISIKTAGTHVSHILRNLDVRTRVEAASIAHRIASEPRPSGYSSWRGARLLGATSARLATVMADARIGR